MVAESCKRRLGISDEALPWLTKALPQIKRRCCRRLLGDEVLDAPISNV
jgi:hypothetical protein